MAALEPYADFIRELFDTEKTHDARFCVEHNLQRRNLVSDLVSDRPLADEVAGSHGKQ